MKIEVISKDAIYITINGTVSFFPCFLVAFLAANNSSKIAGKIAFPSGN